MASLSINDSTLTFLSNIYDSWPGNITNLSTVMKLLDEKNTSLAAKGALAHRLQCCIACNAATPATLH